MHIELCPCSSGKPLIFCCDNKIAAMMSDFKPGILFKGGIRYEPKKNGFLVIVHSWNNVDCIGYPTEYALPYVFQAEEEAMLYYKEHVRPFLTDLLNKIQKQGKGIEVKRTKLE